MNNQIKSIVNNEIGQLSQDGYQPMIMGGVLLSLNIFLMIFVGLYWTNPIIHQYISGKPL